MDHLLPGCSGLAAFATELLLLVGPDDRVREVSGPARALLGRDAETVVGAGFATLFLCPPLATACLSAWRRSGPAGGGGEAVLHRAGEDEASSVALSLTAFDHTGDPAVGGVVVRMTRHCGDGNGDGAARCGDDGHRLLDVEAVYHTLARSAPYGIFRTDGAGRVIFANGRFAMLAGLASPERAMGMEWLSAVHPADRGRVRSEWGRGAAARQPVLIDFRFTGPDGMEVPVLLQSAPLPEGGGLGGGMVGTVTDMGEYVRTVEALAVAQARSNAVMEAAADAVVVLDDAGLIHSANRAAGTMFGQAPGDLLWQRVDRLLPILFDPAQDRLCGGLLALGGDGVQRYAGVPVIRACGASCPADVSISVMEAGNRRLFIALIRDVTERIEAQSALILAKERAESADRAKTAFLAVMSHELRTPLNAVIGFAQLLESRTLGPPTPERVGEYAHSIRSSGEHLLGLIDQILDISMVESGQMELQEEPVDVAALAADSITLLALEAERRGVAVDFQVADGLPLLWGDSLRLRQVLVNLLSNSIKFTDPGGRVVVGAGVSAKGGVVLSVQDSGIGIPAGDIPRILVPFGQLDQSITRTHGGTGLGLPLAKRLVERHGGRLLIDSHAGAGTSVTVCLPPSRVIADGEACLAALAR
ncbi:PAS domain S-box-containing protein [Azospirillum fermentarium]|uniref:sensor histidine kinase n=1 Tax=Azospirillum fermentarium TaxID=1233114 RepID=UPI0022268B0D|nr:PAS domain-containing sensor histidine kinase [Azospirillum fermentarium]MCW2246667.1 PAS domain S-box-containing protein [Azospirillum fermentarium]